MRIADWKDYELIDTGSGERLERWGDILLIRPDPQIIWRSEKKDPRWKSAHARYRRSNTGGGRWEVYKKLPDVWKITRGPLTFRLKPMGFKHTGVFPEQGVNWDYTARCIREAKKKDPAREIRVLNLFGYTGAASGLAERPVRWLVDDCVKFVQREIRRGNHYDGIIMDPPSYGRGPGGEVWKLEEQLYGLVEMCVPVLTENPLFFILNSYTTGLSPSVMAYLLGVLLKPRFGGAVSADEIGLPVTATGLALPCGSTAIWCAGD